MSLATVLARIDVLQTQLDPRLASSAPTTSAADTSAAGGTDFSSALASAVGTDGTSASPGSTGTSSVLSSLRLAPAGATAATPTTGSGGPAGLVAAAEGEVGQAEQPPGSNDSPRIAEYRSATVGSGVGPWCAYFASWCARQAGIPLGEQGQGFGAVEGVAAWGQRTGRSLPPGSTPQPGDLIIWGARHIGIVESVDASGSIHTIEGNSSNAVSRRTYGPDGGGATSYVRPG